MNRGLMIGIICAFLMVSLPGICFADKSPGQYITYIQGGESSVTKEAEGMMMTIQDVIPYMNVGFNAEQQLIPTSEVSYFHDPINAALMFSGDDGESVSFVQISHISFSNETKALSMQITPLEYYDGEMLTAYAKDAIAIENINTTMQKTIGVYIEVASHTPENYIECDYRECVSHCGRDLGNILCVYRCGQECP